MDLVINFGSHHMLFQLFGSMHCRLAMPFQCLYEQKALGGPAVLLFSSFQQGKVKVHVQCGFMCLDLPCDIT